MQLTVHTFKSILTLSTEISQTDYTHRGLSSAYRPYSRSTVDLGDPYNLRELFREMGSHTHVAYSCGPTRPKLALAVWITRPGPKSHTPIWTTRVDSHTLVTHTAQFSLASMLYTAYLTITRPCPSRTTWFHRSHTRVMATAYHTGDHTPVWCRQFTFLAFVKFYFLCFRVHTWYHLKLNRTPSTLEPKID
ncbi:hypothetical protein J1N35_017991 [Gossypium stocksii]|uniref:Uncharacterized protein n=1 Tax=Gossypium stocksii TaxID=47602 RepID=A0A9D3VNE2_9ROSI|nr:hypothetical protein J1N35_017991 [Gossypium stocksii]